MEGRDHLISQVQFTRKVVAEATLSILIMFMIFIGRKEERSKGRTAFLEWCYGFRVATLLNLGHVM